MKLIDLTTKDYWERNYATADISNKVRSSNFISSRYEEIFFKYLPLKRKIKLLEVGCGKSTWLPFFYKYFDCEIWGIDYSEHGCMLAEKILEKNGIPGTIMCCDLFDNNIDLYGKFDVVVSFGLIEHFNDTAKTIRAVQKLIKKKGMIITDIPNYTGLVGYLQKIVYEKFFNMIVVISKEELRKCHERLQFKELYCNYLGSINLCMLWYDNPIGIIKTFISRIFSFISKIMWIFFDKFDWHPESKILSPYIIYIGKNNK